MGDHGAGSPSAWLSLRLASAWRFRLEFESPLPGAQAFEWHYRRNRLQVTKGGQAFAETDGGRHLRVDGRDVQAGPRRWLADPQWPRPSEGGDGFTLTWGKWCGGPVSDLDGVRIGLDGHPTQGYLARSHEPRWRLGLRTHVTVAAVGTPVDLDRMSVLLAYFWANAYTLHSRAGS